MKLLKALAVSALGLLPLATAADAAIVSLNFEGIALSYPDSGTVEILEFYNGGTSSAGTSGTNFGVSFGRNALQICLNSTSDFCSNTSRGGVGDPGSRRGALFFLSGTETFLNYAAGFTTGFSFNYVSLNFAGSVGVYDDLNGTGNLLATLNLNPNAGSCPGYNAGFCPFSPTGVLFAGIAKSISFGGVANQIVFDDITFGSDVPGPAPIPLPATLPLAAAALGALALLRRRVA
jgi:hypothetical protein